jgi:hypothetical protein
MAWMSTDYMARYKGIMVLFFPFSLGGIDELLMFVCYFYEHLCAALGFGYLVNGSGLHWEGTTGVCLDFLALSS